MKKLLTLLAMTFTIMIAHAQQEDNSLRLKIDSLEMKLDNLQRDYDFLYCDYRLSTLNSELKIFVNELKIITGQIFTSALHDNFTYESYKGYKMTYDACLDYYETLKSDYRSLYYYVSLKIENSKFHEQEFTVLKTAADTIKSALDNIEGNLKYFKSLLDAYEDLN